MSIEDIGAYFDERSRNWDQVMEPSGVKHLMVAQLAGVREGSRVLDVGCGTGIMARAYLELGASSIVGLDLSQGMIDRARDNFADVPSERLRFECGDIMSYETGELFDAVVIYNAYPHFLNKQALVEATARLLKPQGRFLVAHGMGRHALNQHHHDVPANVTSDLLGARESADAWRARFDIDMLADAPFIYFFGGIAQERSANV